MAAPITAPTTATAAAMKRETPRWKPPLNPHPKPNAIKMKDTVIDADTGAIVLQAPEGLAPQTVSLITEGFSAFYTQADEWRQKAASIVVTSIEDKDQIKAARDARLALKNIRVGADKTRKAMKEDSLRLGRAIDGAYNLLEHAIKPLETYLEDQEKIAERLEHERLQNLRETRLAALKEADPDHIPSGDVAAYFDADFEKILGDVRDLRKLRIERQQREEQERIEREKKDAEERERIRLENEKLKAEAAARELEMKAERERMEKERREAEETARKEREAAEAKARAEAAARAKAEAEARELREAAEKREREERAAAAKVEADRIAAEKKAAKAPDKAKLRGFAQQVRLLVVPEATTDDGKRVAAEIASKVEGFAKWIETQTESL
jgi:hypothetical protein